MQTGNDLRAPSWLLTFWWRYWMSLCIPLDDLKLKHDQKLVRTGDPQARIVFPHNFVCATSSTSAFWARLRSATQSMRDGRRHLAWTGCAHTLHQSRHSKKRRKGHEPAMRMIHRRHSVCRTTATPKLPCKSVLAAVTHPQHALPPVRRTGYRTGAPHEQPSTAHAKGMPETIKPSGRSERAPARTVHWLMLCAFSER
ncbi:hypothetical protein FVE85_2020 [Porphyridium purpureum]|uniref:Secreted protein n=1 Tax=Porphyridium purpureum TaxID=35688 RepID=A0A5J4YXJ3_PORPP|nr:hypothetical protein FVE85_2020 [Porphyridium purpureum]|eukprot:POR8292..scf209_3